MVDFPKTLASRVPLQEIPGGERNASTFMRGKRESPDSLTERMLLQDDERLSPKRLSPRNFQEMPEPVDLDIFSSENTSFQNCKRVRLSPRRGVAVSIHAIWENKEDDSQVIPNADSSPLPQRIPCILDSAKVTRDRSNDGSGLVLEPIGWRPWAGVKPESPSYSTEACGGTTSLTTRMFESMDTVASNASRHVNSEENGCFFQADEMTMASSQPEKLNQTLRPGAGVESPYIDENLSLEASDEDLGLSSCDEEARTVFRARYPAQPSPSGRDVGCALPQERLPARPPQSTAANTVSFNGATLCVEALSTAVNLSSAVSFEGPREAWIQLSSPLQSDEYLDRQPHLNNDMRHILFDWIVEAQLSWEMREETLLLTFNIVDRFFQKVIVTRGIVQLVGLAATWIAAKYEEVGVPHISQFVDIAANIYTKDNICHMEKIILGVLGYNLGEMTQYHYTTSAIGSCGIEPKCEGAMLAMYLSEMGLHHSDMLVHYGMELGAAAAAVALSVSHDSRAVQMVMEGLAKHIPTDQLPTECRVRQCAQTLISRMHQVATSNYRMVYQKYCSPRLLQVACIKIPNLVP